MICALGYSLKEEMIDSMGSYSGEGAIITGYWSSGGK